MEGWKRDGLGERAAFYRPANDAVAHFAEDCGKVEGEEEEKRE